MTNHPVTPMIESDVRVHLAQQTHLPIGLIDYLTLREQRAEQTLQQQIASGHRIVALDAVDDESLAEVGRLIWEYRDRGIFAVGSQGLEYALVAFWRQTGLIPEAARPRAAATERIAVVSGSCSAVTSSQIAWAEAHGFRPIRIEARVAVDQRAWASAVDSATERAMAALAEGRDPIVFSARGPDDPAIRDLAEAIDAAGADRSVVNEAIGRGLGLVLESIFRRTSVRRGILAGGDTSGHGSQVLGIEALTLAGSTTPGAALFRAHTRDTIKDNLELALKGGQMGSPEYFGQIKNGGL